MEEAGAGKAVAPTPVAIADAVLGLLQAPQVRAEMAARARMLARSDYSLAAMGEGLLAMYADARNRGAAP